jgi:hypothetical protein
VPNHKFLKIILISLPVVLLILVLLTIFISNNNASQISTNVQPTPTVGTPSTAPFNPSKWAGDEDVLKIEEQITGLEKEMGNTDLRLQPILPPDLDMAIKF